MLTRRSFVASSLPAIVAGSVFLPTCGASAANDAFGSLVETFAKIETDSGGRLGVAVLDTRTSALVGNRLDERFPLCSTFKAVVAGAILARIDDGKEQLGRRIPIAASDILSYAPITKQHVGADGLSVGELCEAAVTVSDNTAANLLVASLGGPAAITAFLRSLGDETTRLDRTEPDLNQGEPGDPRDTTTPAAIARTMAKLSIGAALNPGSRDQLNAWLIACKTGDAKLRAGLPKGWRVGDKTGSGGHGASNDVAVIWPDGRAPVIVAAYLAETSAPDEKKNAAHAAVGRAVAAALVG